MPGSPEPMNAGNIVKSDPTQSVAATGGAVPPPWSKNRFWNISSIGNFTCLILCSYLL